MSNGDPLVAAALQALARAYAPYSKFRVGAALEGKSGKIYAGANVENASLGLSICAERAAVFRAVCDGEKEFTRIAIVTSRGKATAPCGACRQVLTEFAPDLEVVMVARRRRKKKNLRDLLPDSFRLR